MRLNLPSSEKDLVDALNRELSPSENEMNVNLLAWKIIDAYLAGVRYFKVVDRWAGELSIAWEDEDGKLKLRYEAILGNYSTEIGRYMQMDISPVCRRIKEAMGALRKAGVGNAVLKSVTAHLDMDKLKMRALIPFLKYGNVAFQHHLLPQRHRADWVEVVHPKEMRGLPAWGQSAGQRYGIARERYITYEQLVEEAKSRNFDRVPKESDFNKLNVRDVGWGSAPPGHTHFETGVAEPGVSDPFKQNEPLYGNPKFEKGGSKGPTMKDSEGRPYLRFREVTAYDDTGEFADRFIVQAGDLILHDVDLRGTDTVPSLHMARHTDTDMFFARGFVGPLIPFNQQTESMLANLFKNISELDMFGTLFVPSESRINTQKWQTGPRPRVDMYTPDPLFENHKPFAVQPANAGLLPAKAAEVALAELGRLSGQGPFYQGQTSGRIDSSPGLGLLYNAGNVRLGLPANGMANALSGIWSRVLQVAKERFSKADSPQVLEMAMVDDAMAGVVMDPNTGQVSLTNNPVPWPWEVKVDIKDRTPRDAERRKQELLVNFSSGLTDWERYWITVLEENIDVPGAPQDLWETWRTAKWKIVILFGDGVTPGKIPFNDNFQDPLVQLTALQTFMNKIEFQLASPQVRFEFVNWKESLEQAAGQFPPGLGAVEDFAGQAVDQQRAAGAGGGGRQAGAGAGGPQSQGMVPGGQDMERLLASLGQA